MKGEWAYWAGMQRPNILLMMSDDHRADAMGCMGDATVSTPFLDQLAAQGCHLRGAHHMGGHSPAVCVPARAGLFTGRQCFAASSGIDSYGAIGTIPGDNVLIGQALRGAGYTCFHTGKWHLDRASLNRCFNAGADIFLGGMDDHFSLPVHAFDPSGVYPAEKVTRTTRHSTEVFVDRALEFLGERAAQAKSAAATHTSETHTSETSSEPFFLSCCFTSPHDPRRAPPEWHARYPVASIPLPENFCAKHPFDNGELTIRDELLAASPRDPAEIRQHIADYYAMISHQDHHMGRLVAELDRLGLGENTIVIYTGDHGLAVGRHGLMGKQNCYEHAMRIPLIMRGPGVPVNAVRSALCYGFDLFPTLCDLTGIAIPASVDGHSVVPVLNGDDSAGRDGVYGVYMDAMAMWSTGIHKVIRTYTRADGRGSDRVQVFDLRSDRHEQIDLAGLPEHAGLRRQLVESLHRAQVELGDPLAAHTLDPVA